MPQMGVSVAEGTVIEWKKRVGDWVEADEPIVEISTDKVETKVPAPASGRVTAIAVDVNSTVDVGTVLATIDTGATPGVSHVDEHAVDHPAPISPVVRRIAEEHHIDLSQVPGTGRRGRVTKKDVLAFIEQAPKAEPTLHIESPYREDEEPTPPSAVRRPPSLSTMRRRIGEHMRRSLDT